MLKELKNRFRVMSISFTITTIIYLLLYKLNITSDMNSYVIESLLLLNFLVAFLMMLTDRLQIRNKYFASFIELLDIFFVVFLVGGVFLKLFPFKPYIIVIISLMNIAIYFGVWIVITYKNVKDARTINEKLKSRRDKKNE